MVITDPRTSGKAAPENSNSTQGDMETDFLVSVIRLFVIVTAIFSVLVWLPGIEPTPLSSFAMTASMVILFSATWVLARRGQAALAGKIFLAILLGAITTTSFAFGFESAVLGSYPLVVLFAALIRGWRTALVYAGLSVVILALLLGANLVGLVPTHYIAPSPIPAFVVAVIYVLLVAVFLSRSLRRLTDAQVSATRSERRLAELVRDSPDGFIFFSDDFVVEDCNLKVVELTGHGESEIVGAKLDQLPWLEKGSRERLEQTFERVLQDEIAELLELEVVDGQGERKTLEAHIKVVVHEEVGRSIQVVARDITERIRIQEEREMLQRQLREARRLESLGRLAGGVAHDFNNLLMVVLGNSELLATWPSLPPAAKEYVKQISNAGDRAAALTTQLLAFARRQVLEPRVLDVNEVVGGLEGLLRRLLPENIVIRIVTSDSAAMVRADPSQLEQVVVNLAVNARDAMPEGGQLTVETGSVELDEDYCLCHSGVEPGRLVMVTVTDTGDGMSHETLGQIFEPFFTTKGRRQGTGLGLATVHGIVKQSGGHIFVYSEPERGSCFKVYLPEVDEKAEQLVAKPEDDAPASGEVVLVVDDDEMVRETIRRILESAGYKVLIASDGAEALEMSKEHSGLIHVLITDVIMPKMGGRALADAMLEQRSELKVLYMSGYAENAIVHSGELEEGLHFVAKPASPKILRQKIRAILHTSSE